MRWVSSGNGGNSSQASNVRRLMSLLFGPVGDGRRKKCSRHELSPEAVAEACNGEALKDLPESWQPYYVSFEESVVSKEVDIPQDELHSVLAHFAHRAKGHVVLHSKFPTRMKLRFFKTEPAELAQSDPLLRKILPIMKVVGGVHTFDTAQALAKLGGQPSQLSNALWQAQGDEFSVEKDEFGYMLAVLRPADEVCVEQWVTDIVSINQIAHRTSIGKLDAAYIALARAAEASVDADEGSPSPPLGNSSEADAIEATSADAVLTSLIDEYFGATGDPSSVVAGDGREHARLLKQALGDEYRASAPPTQPGSSPRASQSASSNGVSDERQQLEGDAVYSVLARLMMGGEWPTMLSDDPTAVAHVAAQFLAGIGSQMLPAAKWKDHRCWGRFKEFGDFELLEQLVGSAYYRLQAALEAKKRKAI